MAAWHEPLLQGLSGVAAILYLVVAIVQARRPVSREAREARNGFVFWWGGLAALGVFGLLTSTVLDTSELGVNGYRIMLYTLIPVLMGMLAGLVYYLIYLYTGSRRAIPWVSAGYSLLMMLAVLFVELQDPYVGLDPETGERGLLYAKEAAPWMGATFSLLLVAPPFAAAVAYAALFFRTADRTARYRIAMVSGGFVLWFGFSLLGTLGSLAAGEAGGEQGFARQLTGQLLGVLAGVLVLLAYYPPRWVRGRLQIRSVAEPSPTADKQEVFGPPKRRMASHGALDAS